MLRSCLTGNGTSKRSRKERKRLPWASLSSSSSYYSKADDPVDLPKAMVKNLPWCSESQITNICLSKESKDPKQKTIQAAVMLATN